MIDNRTSNLNLPLPDPANPLNEDVLRIRDAFTAIDQKIAALDLLLGSDDLTLDTLQDLVTAIKSARSEMGAVTAQLTAQNTATTAQLTAQNTAINTQLTAQNTAAATQIAALSALVYAGL